ncbi:MAG: type II secretion system protein GspL [Halioglobus sp.]
MHDSIIIRQIDDQLVWYRPGAEEGYEVLDSQQVFDRVNEWAKQPRVAVCFAVPGTDVSLMTSDFSASEKKHITKALPFILEERLVSDVDDLHFASVLLGKTSLCAAVCAKQKMHDWQALLAPIAGIDRWVSEPQLLPWQPGEWVLVIESDYAIVRIGAAVGFSIECDLLASMLGAALANGSVAPNTVIVYGADQALEKELLPEAVQELMQWRKGDFRTAVMLTREDDVTVNLLQGEFALRLPLERWWKQWRVVAAVLVAAFTLQLVAGYASYMDLEQENLELRRAIESSYRRAFPKGALVDPEKQVRRQLDALRGTAQSSGFTQLLNRVGEIVAAKPGTSIASINYSDKGGDMRINITAADFETVEAIRTQMTESGLEAVMESSNAQGNQVRARLRIGAGS